MKEKFRWLVCLGVFGTMGCETPNTDDGVLWDFGDTAPLFEGPFEYAAAQEGVYLIDLLWIVTEEAVAEIEGLDETPGAFLNWRIDDMNDTLERSLIDSSIVRPVGVHVMNAHDIERTGVEIGQTDVNISNALNWLGTYRESYGADKVIIVAGTKEGASGAALGGGDVSAHWVDFLPIEHEFGHQMGASHCNEGDPDAYNFGYPASGYNDDGFPIKGGPVSAGTRMCGNSVAIYSNPDLWLSLAEIDDLIADGLAPKGDWEALADEDGWVPFGDPVYADMAQQWRDVEADAAERKFTALYAGEASEPYPLDDCVGLFDDEGYGSQIAELCAGNMVTDLSGVSAVQLGSGVHVNLYSDTLFGAESMCGGQLLRLSSSSPSLEAMSAHHQLTSLNDNVGSVLVYDPDDREAHYRNDGPYAFYGTGTQPNCQGAAGNELVLMPDNYPWTATAAAYKSPVDVPFAVDFALRTYHDNEDPVADGFNFFFGKASDSYEGETPQKSQLGFIPDGTGYALMVNTWTYTVGLRDGNWEVLGEDVSHNSDTEGKWVSVRIEVRQDSIEVSWDGEVLYSADVVWDTTHSSVGFSARTGYYMGEYRLRDIEYTAI